VNVPGSGDTIIGGINAHGDFVGAWDTGLSATTISGFVSSKGEFTSFDLPFLATVGPQANDINNAGSIVGLYSDDGGIEHGFVKVGPAFTNIDYPGAAGLTSAWGINSAGEMVGNWRDSSGNLHGWLAEPSNRCLAAPNDMIAWWPGDGNARDVVSGANGVPMGAGYAKAFVDKGFTFDGIDDYVNVPDAAVFHAITTAVTVDAWINPQLPIHGEGWIFSRRDPLISEGVALHILGDGFLLTTLQTDVSSEFISIVPVISFNGEWQHVAVTADTRTGQVALYVNGKPVPFQSIGGSPFISGTFANVSHVFIGQREDSDALGEDPFWGCRYKGLIDEVQLFNRALTPSEILTIYQAGGNGVCKR
jgi:hypothetical protein